MMINVISQHLPGCGDAFEVCLCTGSTHELGVTKMTAVFALLCSLTGIAVSALSKIWSTSTWPKDGDLEIEQPSNWQKVGHRERGRLLAHGGGGNQQVDLQ